MSPELAPFPTSLFPREDPSFPSFPTLVDNELQFRFHLFKSLFSKHDYERLTMKQKTVPKISNESLKNISRR